MENPNNRMIAAGRLERRLELSHEVMNEPFYSGTLLVKRLSGAVDRLPLTLPGKLLTEELVELLTVPADLATYKVAITQAMYKGTKRNIESEKDAKNVAVG